MNSLATIHPVKNDILAMIDNNPKLQDSTKSQYKKAISNYLKTGNSLTDSHALAEYSRGLNKSSRSFLKAAIRLWGDQVTLDAKSQATPENIGAIQATVYRVEALNESIQVEAMKGEKSHIWLNQSQVKELLNCNSIRDKVVLGLLVGAGLRREELAGLTFDDIIIQPVKGKYRTVLNVRGKGNKNRSIPINDKLAELLNEWREITGPGLIARSITKGGVIGKSLSPIGIFQIVSRAGERIGKPELAPHDLRRTYAQLGYEAGIAITQISKLLGHSNVATTQRYLNLDLDLGTTISDFIPF